MFLAYVKKISVRYFIVSIVIFCIMLLSSGIKDNANILFVPLVISAYGIYQAYQTMLDAQDTEKTIENGVDGYGIIKKMFYTPARKGHAPCIVALVAFYDESNETVEETIKTIGEPPTELRTGSYIQVRYAPVKRGISVIIKEKLNEEDIRDTDIKEKLSSLITDEITDAQREREDKRFSEAYDPAQRKKR